MSKYLKIAAIIIFSIFILSAPGLCVTEEMTITTYYPSPYGVYKVLRLYPTPEYTKGGTCNSNEEGEMIYDDNNNQVLVCDGATNTWQAIGDPYWMPSGSNIYNNNSGNVGIGTSNPVEKLHLEGSTGSGVMQIRLAQTAGANPNTWDIGPVYGAFRIDDVTGGTTPFRIFPGAPEDSLVITSGGSAYFNGGGNVGIGTTTPTANLHVNGNIKAVLTGITGGSTVKYDSDTDQLGLDIAELFEANEEVVPGDVLSIDENGKLNKSALAYDSRVAGVVSSAPAILFEGSQLQIAPLPFEFKKGNKPPLALAGRVKCKVTKEGGGVIKTGDLLVTSAKPGYAMKGDANKIRIGTVLGKALEPLNEKEGSILVLLTLQ